MNHRIDHAVDLIRQADAIIVGAGAGMGMDSGLPDFRGPNGFWRAYPALGRRQIRFESIASPDAFRRWPRLAWGFYGHRLKLYRKTQPHEGFRILQNWAADSLFGISANSQSGLPVRTHSLGGFPATRADKFVRKQSGSSQRPRFCAGVHRAIDAWEQEYPDQKTLYQEDSCLH